MSLPLKISILEINQQRTMRFAATMSVYEACRQVAEKINITGEDHGLFYPSTQPKEKPYWLRMDRTLGYYELDNGTLLEYKKMHRLLKVRLLDNTQKKILIDDSLTVTGIVEVLGEKLGLDNTDEFSLQVEGKEGNWLNPALTLHEQGVGLEDGVILKKKFFVTDSNVDTDNPAQVHFVYIQSRNSILDGTHPTTQLEAVQFAALESQINYGNYNPAVHTTSFFKGTIKDILPPAASKDKGIDKDIIIQWKKILGMTELNAKFRYIQLSRSLKTYGITCFNVNEILTDLGKKRLMPIMLGITRDSVLKMDPNTKEVLLTFPLRTVKRWAASPQSFTVDFGDHQDDYLSVQTKQGEAIAQLMAGYVDIILKKRKDTGRIVIKDDTILAAEETIGVRSRGIASAMSSVSSWGKTQQTGGMTNVGSMQHVSSSLGGMNGVSGNGQPVEALSRLMSIKNGMSGKQQICDLKSAKNAIDDLLNELGTATSMLKSDPFAVLGLLGVPDGIMPTSMRGQLGQKLAIAATSVGKTAMKMYGMSEEELVAAMPELDEEATRLARELATLLESAILHSSVDDKMADGTLETTKTLVEGARLLIADIMKLKENPSDNVPKDALKMDLDMLQLAECILRGTGESLLIDQASRSLLEETAAALHALTTEILQAVASPEVEGMIEDETLKSNLLIAARTTNGASQKTLQQIQMYGATMLMVPGHHNFIMDALKELDSAREGMMETLLECSGTEAADLLMNQYEAIAAGIEQLMVAVQCVSRQSDGAPALAAAAKAVQMATAQLLSATTMASDEILFENAKDGAKDAMDALIAISRNMAAQASDKTTKQKLLQGIDNMLEAVKQLTDSAALAVKHPNDPLKQEKVMVASQKLAMAIQQVVGDAERQAAVGALIASVKETAASSSSLITMARASSLHTQRVDPKNSVVLDVFKSCKDTAEALGLLMAALKTSSGDNIDDLPATLTDLVAVSQQAAAPASNLVAVLKVNSNRIGSSAKSRTDLRAKAEAVASTIQALLSAAQQVVETNGIAEISESVKELEGVESVVDAAILAAGNGSLPVTPGLVEENAIELLAHATTGLAPPTLQLVEACRDPSTKQIGPSSRACVSSTHQIVAASKTLASTFPKGQQQVNLLQSTKSLVEAMSKLFVAARTASSHPGDPAMAQVLLAASRGVAEARTNVMRTAKGAHDPVSNQCDLAAEAIRKESEKLKSSLFNSGNFNTFIDQLTQCAKAIQTASIQLSDSIHESGDALTASCQSTAALVPSLVDAINNTAATAPKEDDKEAIVKAGNLATTALAGLIVAAKISFLNKGDELSINGLVEANKAVDDSLTGLLNTCNSARPGQMESEAALDLISKSVAMLELSADYPPEADHELSKSPEHVKEVVSDAAKALAGHSSQILATSRAYPEKAGQSALDAAKNIATILTAIKASTPRVEGITDFTITAKEIEHLLQSVIDNANKPKVIIKGTKALAPLIADLMGESKKVASLLTDHNAQQKLIKVAQQVHNLRNEFVNHAKAAAVKSPGSDVQLRTSAEDLQRAVDKLVSVASKVLPQETVAPELKAQNELLLSSSRSLAVATSQLILASKIVSSRPKDSSIHMNLSIAAKEVSQAIQSLLHATQGLAPDQIKCDEALESLSEIMENLDGLALSASVGGLVSYATISHDTARDDLARNALELGQAVSQMVTSALKKEAASLASAAGTTSDTSRAMLVAITAAASSTSERNVQKQLLALSKAVADCVYKVVEACKAAGTSSAEESQQRLADVSKTTSEAIKGLIATLKLGVAGSKDCDEAVANIGAIIKQLDEPFAATSKKSFKQSKDELAIVAKAIAPAISKLVNVSKSMEDAGELGTAARAMSDTMPMLVAAVRNSVAVTTSETSKTEIVASGKAVANAARLLIQNAKVVASDRNNQVAQKKLVASQVALNESVARLGSSMATGEMECETAANEIRNLISSLDTAALFVAAGQFEVTENGDSVEEIQSKLAKAAANLRTKLTDVTDSSTVSMEKLGSACKELTANLSLLIANCKIAAAQTGEIPLQQSVLAATRTVAVTSRAVVVASRDLCAAPEVESNKRVLDESKEQIEKNISSLLNEAQTAAQEALKGEKKMNAAKAEILRLLDRVDEADNIGNQNASPTDVIESAKGVASATALVISSCNSSQEELLNNAKIAVKANAQLLANAKGATRLTRDKNQQQHLIEAAKRVSTATTKLFESLKTSNKNTVSGQRRLNDSSEEVANAISDVITSAGALPGADKAKMGDTTEEIAEAELIAAANAIEEAAATLRTAMPVKKEGEKEENWTAQELMVGDAVLEGTRSIANATAALVRAAGTLQRELAALAVKQTGKPNDKVKFYRKDSIFTQGLISAAKAVAAATKQLVISANSVTEGMDGEEAVIAAAKAVASATAQLVSSSRVKAGTDNPSQKKLQEAAKGVIGATSELVETAKSISSARDEEKAKKEADEEAARLGQEASNYSKSIVAEMEQQMRILKLEKELEKAREQLLSTREKNFHQ